MSVYSTHANEIAYRTGGTGNRGGNIMIIKHYKIKSEAEANCPGGHKLILEGNADRRWRVVTEEEYGRIIGRGKTSAIGSDTQTRSGNFLQ